MSKAIGMIEFKTTATGITAADLMVKTSEVEIVEAQTVCPGKYIAIITGTLSAVKAAVDTAVAAYEDKCIDSFVLGNPHESIFPAMYGATQVEDISVLYDLPMMKVLTMSGNQIRDIGPVLQMQELNWLEVAGNPIDDETVFDRLPESVKHLEK